MQSLYQWIDEIPLSWPKRNIGRDFSDGVLAAELVAHFFPKLVELHNYSAANSVSQKMYNWNTLNQKVFKKMGMQVSRAEVEGVCNCSAGVVERVISTLRQQIAKIKEQGALPAPKVKAKRSPPAVKSAGAAPGRQDKAEVPVPPRRSKDPERRQGGSANQPKARVEDPYGAPEVNPYAPPPRGVGSRLRQEAYDPPAEAVGRMPALDQQVPHMPAFNAHVQRDVDTEILVEKEQTIQELRETVDILETKVRKLEQLVKLKDTKIQSLQGKLSQAQSAAGSY